MYVFNVINEHYSEMELVSVTVMKFLNFERKKQLINDIRI